MVLEKLYDALYIKEHKHIAFILGIAYAICGISFSVFLFPDDPAPMAIAFISLISVVSLKDILIFEKKILTGKSFVRQHRDILILLSYMFMGILITFAFFSIFMPMLTTTQVFSNQVGFVHTLSAKDIFDFGDIGSIFMNNAKVLLVCILTAFLFGMSTIFLLIIIWNASVIGVVFGVAAKQSALISNRNPLIYFLLILLAALPHIILEISAYLFGGIVGDRIALIATSKNRWSKTNQLILTGALFFLLFAFMILILAASVETNLTPNFIELLL